MASELVGELRALSAAVDAQVQGNWREDVQAMLHAQKSEILQSLAGQHPDLRDAAPKHRFPFNLDPDQQEVRIGRRRIPLTPNEFKVVQCLWEASPGLVSREVIIGRLYDQDTVRSKRVVDVFVSNVRNKLRDAGATDVQIESKSGQGWRLVLEAERSEEER